MIFCERSRARPRAAVRLFSYPFFFLMPACLRFIGGQGAEDGFAETDTEICRPYTGMERLLERRRAWMVYVVYRVSVKFEGA